MKSKGGNETLERVHVEVSTESIGRVEVGTESTERVEMGGTVSIEKAEVGTEYIG